MIAEPYIFPDGTITWFQFDEEGPFFIGPNGGELRPSEKWQRYCDFEREKLRELELGRVRIGSETTFVLGKYKSVALINYWLDDYYNDTESNRLLERAEFVKAVCEREDVAWLPKPCPCGCHAFNGEASCPSCFDDCTDKRRRFPPKGIDVVKELCEEDLVELESELGADYVTPEGRKLCEAEDCEEPEDEQGEPNEPPYYTKAEIDERLEGLAAIIRAIGRAQLTGKPKNKFTNKVDEFYLSFLS